jgi:hypothetical protein
MNVSCVFLFFEIMTSATNAAHSIVSLVMDELRLSLEPKILNALSDYGLCKETHEAVMNIPFVKRLLDNQCRCNVQQEPIQLEIIDAAIEHKDGLDNLDSIKEYMNSTALGENNDANIAANASEFEYSTEEEDDDDDLKKGTTNDEEEEEQVEEEPAAEQEEEQEEEEPAAEQEEEQEEEELAAEQEEEQEEEELAAEQEEEQEEEELAAEQEEEKEEEEPAAEQEEEQEEEEQEDEQEEEEKEEEEEPVAEQDEEQEKQEEKEDEKADEEDEEQADEEELELFEVEIKGKTYVTNDEMEGDIYDYTNEEVGEIVGSFKNGIAKLTKKSSTMKK